MPARPTAISREVFGVASGSVKQHRGAEYTNAPLTIDPGFTVPIKQTQVR